MLFKNPRTYFFILIFVYLLIRKEKNEFDQSDHHLFKNFFSASGDYFSMRFKKVEDFYKFVCEKRAALIKGPAGSGKSFFAHLFRYYLFNVKKMKESQVHYMIAENYKNSYDFILEFEKNTKLDFSTLQFNLGNYFIIIDEAHNLYSQERFNLFWDKVKHCSEQNCKVYFIFCAIYSNRRADSADDSPLIFSGKFKSFDFLRFDEEEFSEFINKYNSHEEAHFCPINQGKAKILFKIFQGIQNYQK